VIHIRDLSVTYADHPVLQDVTLEVGPGECVMVTGPSGCGKSTLAYTIGGLIPHAIPARLEGSVVVGGMDVAQHPISEIAQHVGLVFQNPATQLFHLKVADEVAFGPRNLGLSESEVSARKDWALEATGMTDLRERSPATLSGGQKQCLAIAAVLAMRPGLLVLDEPTASLDVPSTRRVMRTLHGLQTEYGITILLIEHRLAEARPFVNRVLLMEDGRVISDASPEEVFSARKNRQVRGLRRLPEAPLDAWEALILPDGTAVHSSPPVLSLRGVSAGYDRQPVIDEIDLDLYPGEITALVGDNGAGKTTLALAAAGLVRPMQGRAIFNGGLRPRPGLDVALLFQNPAEQLFTDSVDEEVGFGPRNYGVYSPIEHEFGLSQADLTSLKARRPTTLSAGQQQRTALAACLALRPRVIILDEPTLGQDWAHLQQLMDYLVTLQKAGASILLITHDFKLVHRYAQRVILMKEGRITLHGRTNGHMPTSKSGLTRHNSISESAAAQTRFDGVES